MKILVLADCESKFLWDYFEKEKLANIDLIISCGDLAPQYLSFLATFSHAPVLYVHGNHDDCYAQTPPEGCICIEDSVYQFKGLRILGLGGSVRYKDGEHQYTQRAMKKRVQKLWPKLLFYKGFDILVTHAPAYDVNDGDDLAHTGFRAFNELIVKYKPEYFIHGHVHQNYGGKFKRCSAYESTTVINAYERYEIESERV
ncbi:MAG: metallophosphoesterase family protein [Clostridium sp.]